MEKRLKYLSPHSEAKYCNNVHCDSECHQNQIDEFLEDIIRSINSVATKCVPSTGCCQNTEKTKTRFAAWQEGIQPFKDAAMFWHSIWLSAGRPLNTELHKIMKKNKKPVPLPNKKKWENGQYHEEKQPVRCIFK